jgi:hypothetical protein
VEFAESYDTTIPDVSRERICEVTGFIFDAMIVQQNSVSHPKFFFINNFLKLFILQTFQKTVG